MSYSNWTSTQSWNVFPTPEPPLEGKLLSDALDLGYVAGEVYLLHRPIQCLVIVTIIITAVVCNVLVIHNIWMCQLKMRTTNFLLIKNLCIVDLIGACVVLPVPLLATAKGVWDFGAAMCKANSTVNIALWFQHILMFAMLKIDRVLASCLPFGKYPIFSVEVVTVIVLLSWFVSFFVAGLVTAVFNSSYEPAVVLCIPELPVEFFLTIFSIYCAALLAMVVGYILVIWHLKKKREEIRSTQGVEVADYSGLERSALTSFLITISHFLMYVPTMLVIGLHGWFLHPIAILICDMVVYAEFSIHPIVLLSTSTKMRKEIMHTIKIIIQDVAAVWRTEFPRCLRHKGLVYAVTPEEPNNAESFNENPRATTCNSTPTAFQVTNDHHQLRVAEETKLQTENDKISHALDVVFHRTDSPEPIRPVGQPSFYPVNLKHRPLNPVLVERPGSIRANGRSISRENCSKKITGNETNRRHASLPTSPSDDVMKKIPQTKRHSIPVTLPNKRPYHFLTASFFSTLLSEPDVNVDIDTEDRLSMENVDIVLDEDIRLSTEIVYKFCDLVNEDTERGLLTEPALYRLDQVISQKITKTQSCDSFEEIMHESSLNGTSVDLANKLLLEPSFEESRENKNGLKIIKTRSRDSFEEMLNDSSKTDVIVIEALPDVYVTGQQTLNGVRRLSKTMSSDSFEGILNGSAAPVSEIANVVDQCCHELGLDNSDFIQVKESASNEHLSRVTKWSSSDSQNDILNGVGKFDTQEETNEIFI